MYEANSSCDNGMKCDILLFANFFEKSRNISLKNYKLCLSHHLSVSTSTLDAMLNITRALILCKRHKRRSFLHFYEI